MVKLGDGYIVSCEIVYGYCRDVCLELGDVIYGFNEERRYFHAGSEPNKTVEEKDVLDPTQGAEGLF